MPTSSPATRAWVLGTALLLITIQLAIRAWALLPSWFFHDDILLLEDAREASGPSYLIDAYDSQLMPWGRALAWVVESTGPSNWPLAAVLTLLTQLLASLACLWMLSSLFGVRPGILPPLVVYLFTAMTVPGSMWWAASLNLLPLQIGIFASVTTWVAYLRTRRHLWLVGTFAALGFALAAYVKALLIIPLLAALLIAYFTTGSLGRRLRDALREHWLPVLGALAVGAGYLAVYLHQAPPLARPPAEGTALPLARTMLGSTLPTGLLGGPWRWDDVSAPTSLTSPPAILVTLSWIALATFALILARTRARTGRAWLLLAGAAGASYALVLTTRAPLLGDLPGHEYRYLADVACVWALVIALVTMELPQAPESSAQRAQPRAQRSSPVLTRPGVAVVVTSVVTLSAIASTVPYVLTWHRENATADYLLTAQRELNNAGITDLADQDVPQRALFGWLLDRNDQSRVLPLVTPQARFPSASTELRMLDQLGRISSADIADSGVATRPGPQAGCGWLIGAIPVTVPMESGVMGLPWWARLNYLASGSGEIEIRTDHDVRRAPIRQGLSETFLQLDGGFDQVTMRTLDPGMTVCLDTLEIGPLVPKQALS